MKKVILVVICMLLSITCGTYKKSVSWKDIGTDGDMYEIIDDTIGIREFEEICLKDTLVADLENWVKFNYYDGEQNVVEQWFYIKDTDTNTFYILAKITDTTYRMTIRQIK